MEIRHGYVRDYEGIWHRLTDCVRFYVVIEKKAKKEYSQVVCECRRQYEDAVLVGLTENLEGIDAAQVILDRAFREGST